MAFKGVVLECGKPVIQAWIIREACKTHANAQKQPRIADSIFYKSPIQRSDFVNAVEDPTAYQYDNSGTTKEDPYKKKAEEQRVTFLLKIQTQEHSQAMTLEQTLFNIVCGQCSESFLLAIQDKCNDWVTFCREKNLLKLLEIIDTICDNGSTGTKEDRTYVNLTQSRAFYNFLQRPNQTAAKYVQLIGDRYDTLQNRLGKLLFGTGLMEEIIKKKHGDGESIAFYFNPLKAAHVPALDKAYKERVLSRLIIINGNMHECRKEMLHSQQILGTTPFDITWGQATSLLERESLKVMRKKQNRKQDNDSDGIIQLHLAVDNDDNDDVNSHKSTV